MRNIVILCALLAAYLMPEVEAANWEVNQIPAPLGALPFGETVAVSRDGNTALIASPREACADKKPNCGAVRVYVREGQAWRLQQRLSASDAASGKRFGGNGFDDNTIALSADGNIAFIGRDPGSYGDPPGTGAVYVFLRNGGAWSEQQKLVRPDSSETGNDGFGRSVALSDSGDTAIIGDAVCFNNFNGSIFCSRSSSPKGAAYVFTRVEGHWVVQARLTDSRTDLGDTGFTRFGRAVAISGDGSTAVVGSPGSRSDLLEAYVFTKLKGQWREEAILSPADKSTAGGVFGNSVALSRSGDTVLVGANPAAYIFQQNGHHGNWREEAKLGSTITTKRMLGFSVDIDDDGRNAVVGDWHAEESSNMGTAFLFHREEDFKAHTAKWVPDRLLSKFSGVGSGVAISGDANTVLVGYGVYALHRQY